MFTDSQRAPEALAYDEYRAMAERGAQLRKANADPMVEPVERAASAIVDALVADDGPMRYSCDPLGCGLLDVWRASDDEALYGMMAGGYDDA
jgi:hypothetical protein